MGELVYDHMELSNVEAETQVAIVNKVKAWDRVSPRIDEIK